MNTPSNEADEPRLLDPSDSIDVQLNEFSSFQRRFNEIGDRGWDDAIKEMRAAIEAYATTQVNQTLDRAIEQKKSYFAGFRLAPEDAVPVSVLQSLKK